MRAKVIVLTSAVLAILSAIWIVGLRANAVASSWPRLQVLRLPAVPRGLYPATRHSMFAIGMDSNDDVLMQTRSGRLVRYSIPRHRWLRGEIWAGRYTVVTPSPTGGLWLFANGGLDIARAAFGSRVHWVKAHFASYFWLFNDLAVDARGNAWVVGQIRACKGMRGSLGTCSTRDLNALGRIRPDGRRLRIVSLPAAQSLSAVAPGIGGDVWMLDGAGSVLRYHPATGMLHRYLPTPRQDRGEIGLVLQVADSLQVSLDGTVWVHEPYPFFDVPPGLVSLHRGHFVALRQSYQTDAPLIDRRGYLWYQNPSSRPTALDGRSGSATSFAEAPGSLIQDLQRRVWWVEGP